MAFIDGTVVNVALPALQQSFRATVLDVQWVVESYALLLAALLLVGGSMGDRFGRRLVFCWGVALFAIASIGCGFAGSISQLILWRALQGAGGALLVPGSLAIISASFDEARRGRAIGTWSGFTAITAGIGPVMGGWLVEHVSWRAIFFINLPLALAVLGIALLRVPESRDDRPGYERQLRAVAFHQPPGPARKKKQNENEGDPSGARPRRRIPLNLNQVERNKEHTSTQGRI